MKQSMSPYDDPLGPHGHDRLALALLYFYADGNGDTEAAENILTEAERLNKLDEAKEKRRHMAAIRGSTNA